MNYSTKELVRSFDWSDFHTDRFMYRSEVINGRTYLKSGTATATSVVGDLYKVSNPSDKSSKYVLLIGVARQHPCDVQVSYTEGIEIAAVNAKINPIGEFVFPAEICWETFKPIAQAYIDSLPIEFVKTKQEMINAGVTLSKYNRNATKKGANESERYYHQYYEDCKRMFGDMYAKH